MKLSGRVVEGLLVFVAVNTIVYALEHHYAPGVGAIAGSIWWLWMTRRRA